MSQGFPENGKENGVSGRIERASGGRDLPEAHISDGLEAIRRWWRPDDLYLPVFMGGGVSLLQQLCPV